MDNEEPKDIEEAKSYSPEKRISLVSEDAESDDSEGWLVSYADLMTLLACFFILMTAFANYDQPTFKRVAKEVGQYFKGSALQLEKNQNVELATKVSSIGSLKEKTEVIAHEDGLEIKFNTGFLFDTGESHLTGDAIEMLRLLSEVIGQKKFSYAIDVHGHTDSMPLSAGRRFKDNWELSSARAAAVVREFVRLGFSPKILNPIGHADSFPEKEEFDSNGQVIKENQSKNRRVIIFVRDMIKSEKLGLGHAFEKDKLKK